MSSIEDSTNTADRPIDPRKRRGDCLFVIGAILLTAFSTFSLYHVYFRPDPAPRREAVRPSDVRIGEPLTTKVLIACWDSVREAPLRDPIITPFFHRTAERGISGKMTVPGPTLTGISVTSFGSGTRPPLGAAMTNFVVEPWKDEHIFGLAVAAGMKTAFFGDDTWARAFGEGASHEKAYPFSDFLLVYYKDDWYVGDIESIEDAEKWLVENQWNLAAIHFATTDKLAHKYGAQLEEGNPPRPTPYARAINKIDHRLEHLFRLVGSDTTIFLLSDHGCTVSGTHGSYDQETRETRYAAAGPGLRQIKKDVDLDSTEIAPIIARLLGLRAPRCAEAPLRSEVLELTDEEARETMVKNLGARLRFQESVARGGGAPWTGDVVDRAQGAAATGPHPSRTADEIGEIQRRLDRHVADELTASRRRSKIVSIAVTMLGIFALTYFFARRFAGGTTPRIALIGTVLFLASTLSYQLRHEWVYGTMGFAERLVSGDAWLPTDANSSPGGVRGFIARTQPWTGLFLLTIVAAAAAFFAARIRLIAATRRFSIDRRFLVVAGLMIVVVALRATNVPYMGLLRGWIVASVIGIIFHALLDRTSRLTGPLFVLFAGSMTMSWPYGPQSESHFAAWLVFGVFLIAAAKRDGILTRSMVFTMLVVALLSTVIAVMGKTWIRGNVENIYRVVTTSAVKTGWIASLVLAPLFVFFGGAVRRKQSLPAKLLTILGPLCVLSLATVTKFLLTKDPPLPVGTEIKDLKSEGTVVWFGVAALLAAVAVLCLAHLPKFRDASGGALFLLVTWALNRIFVSEADHLMLGLFMVVAWTFARLAPKLGKGHVHWIALGLCLFDLFFFYARGYLYKLSTFDMNTAFTFYRGNISMPAAGTAILLQHAAPIFIAVGALFHFLRDDGLPDDGIERFGEAMRTLVFVVTLRVAASYVALWAFEDEAWYFLRSVHYQFFEALKLGVLLFAWAVAHSTGRTHEQCSAAATEGSVETVGGNPG